MKNKLMFLLLVFAAAAYAQIPEEDYMGPDEAEAEVIFTEESFEHEMFVQKQEEFSQEYSDYSGSEEELAQEEVYDSEVDYND